MLGIIGMVILSDANSPWKDTPLGVFWHRAVEFNYFNLTIAVNFPLFYTLWVIYRLRGPQAVPASEKGKKQ